MSKIADQKDKLLKGLGNEDKTILGNVIAAVLIKGAALLVSLATVPAFMRFFSNNAILGVWYTVVSVMTWILSFDLGIGNGLRNKLVVALEEKNEDRCKELISSAYASIGLFCLAFLVVLFVLVRVIDWNVIYGIDSAIADRETLEFVTTCVMCGMLVQLLLKNANSIFYAIQKSAVNNFIALCVSILQLIFILVFPVMDEILALRVMAVAYSILSNIPLLIATFALFMTKIRFAVPSIRYVSKEASKEVFGLGMAFFLAQVLYMLIANTNEVFISAFFNSADVVEYQVYYKLYSFAGMLITLALTPVWSAVTLAFAKGNNEWLVKTFHRFELLALLVAGVELVLVCCTQLLFNLWLGGNSFTVIRFYSLTFALFGALFSYQGVVAAFANGLGELGTQIKFYSLGFLTKLFVIIAASSMDQSWIFVIVGDAAALIPFCIVQRMRTTKTIKANIKPSEG